MAGKMDQSLVCHIAMLSRLKPSDEEVRLFSEQLSAIVAYVDQLSEVDTTDVQPTAHALPVSSVFRADQPQDSFAPEAALSNAPQRDGHFFALPKVLDQDSA
jgi:aspartyl-tRNA(Asn)/glutamyl-tRNA(Gln) amidotransferase subunit C